MGWKSLSEVETVIEQIADVDRLLQAFNLRSFLLEGVFAPAYQAASEWTQYLTLTNAGQEYLRLDSDITENLPASDVYLALFRRFYHHDLLIDVSNSDLEALTTMTSKESLRNRVRWPYRYGRMLYDKFNNMVSLDGIDHMTPDEVEDLLAGVPQGVYQVGTLLSGPLGFLTSNEMRFLPPSARDLPLWHCSDTGCRAIHHVRLEKAPIPSEESFVRLDLAANRQLGRSSEWGIALRSLYLDEQDSRGRIHYNLPVLIADTILGDERRVLLESALTSSNGAFLREIIGAPPRDKELASGPAEQVATRLTEEQQLQLLLLLTDADLVDLIDRCVRSAVIKIPANELRVANFNPPTLSAYDTVSELSMFGIRYKQDKPLIALFATIWEAYASHNMLPELGWKLLRHPDTPSQNSLMDYIRDKGPKQTVRDLVLSSMPVTIAVAERVSLQISASDDNEQIVDRCLWKCGFNPPRYGDEYSRLRTRLTQFNDVLLSINDISTEENREAIRSAGVNLFVSVEYFIEQLVAYPVWLLSSDHFVNARSRLIYSPELAVENVGPTLGQQLNVGGYQPAWSSVGDNTLGTAMAYLIEARKWSRLLLSKDRSDVERPAEQMPHFAQGTERIFPFKHTELWADCNSGELEALVEQYEHVAQLLEGSNLANVRNGLDHWRNASAFPRIDVMLATVARIQKALDVADTGRLIPKTFWRLNHSEDQFGREQNILQDYMGRTVTINGPATVSGIRKLRFNEPVVIAPGNLLGLPNSEMVFRILDRSQYSVYWAGYPRRRRLLAVDNMEQYSAPATPKNRTKS